MVRQLALAVALVTACKGSKDTAESGSGSQTAKIEDPCRNAKQEGPIAWIADDYKSALACARQKKQPLVLDLWAPWCHTCLSMQTTVFLDKSFADDAKKFVFASLDTDRETNADALTKLAISAWPTFYVVGNDEVVLSRFVGAATIGQFHEFLDAGQLATTNNIAAADAHLLGASRALAVKDLAAAEIELTAAIEKGPAAWMRRPEVLASLILTKFKRNDIKGCLDVADQYMAQTGSTASASDFLVTAMMCADSIKKDTATSEDQAKIKALREKAVARWKQLLADKDAPLSIDDRSDAMASMREALDALGDKAAAKVVAEDQQTLLDDAAKNAPTPLAAMTYNWPRAEVYVYLGKPLSLVPALEKSAKDLPNEYDPRARLGWVYLKAEKLDEAAKWTDEALAMVYGPRKGRVLSQRAEIARAAGNVAAEKRYLDQAVKLYESLPPSQQVPEALAKAKQALAGVVSNDSSP